MGPALEYGWTLITLVALWTLATSAFDDLAASTLEELTDSALALVLIVALFAAVGLYLFGPGAAEAGRMLHNTGNAREGLDEDTKERIRVLADGKDSDDLDREVKSFRVGYLPYWPYSVINIALGASIAWLAGAGLVLDVGASMSAQRQLAASVPPIPTSVEAAQESMETYFGLFRAYQSSMLDLGLDLVMVTAILFAIGFWLLGTPFLKIYTIGVVSMIRTAMSLALLVLLPGFIILAFLRLVWVSNAFAIVATDIANSVSGLTPTPNDLTTIHDIEDRMLSRADVAGFWARLASSSGGVLLALGVVLSIWQDRRSTSSYLENLLPHRGLNVLNFRDAHPETKRSKLWNWLTVVFVNADPTRDEGPTVDT